MQTQKKSYHPLFYLLPLYVLGTYFLMTGLVRSYAFFAPLSIGILVAMIILPLTKKFEKIGLSRFWATFISTFATLTFYLSMFVVVSLQANNIVENRDQVKKRLTSTVENVQSGIESFTSISPEKQLKILNLHTSEIPFTSTDTASAQQIEKNRSHKAQKETGPDKKGGIKAAILGFVNFMGYSLLTVIYIFFLLFYRTKIKLSLLRFFSKEQQPKAKKILKGSLSVAQHYLVGRLVLILFLWIIYSLGMSLSGVDSAILISLIAALLSLIPYVGTVIGFFISLLMASVSGGEAGQFIGVSITYGLAQFVESYILEPYIVGDQVNLNPLATIIVVVLGGLIWGVVGMIISIPFFGIIKIVADQVPELNPIGYMLGKEGMPHQHRDFINSFLRKLKKRFR